jgi:hypothetical protein
MKQEIIKVNQFLEEFFDLINDEKFFTVPRKKNSDCLATLKLFEDDVIDEVLSLTYKDYVSGPHKDNNGTGDIWVFGKVISGHLIYIKLKIDYDNAKCISFHLADWNMKFPLR